MNSRLTTGDDAIAANWTRWPQTSRSTPLAYIAPVDPRLCFAFLILVAGLHALNTMSSGLLAGMLDFTIGGVVVLPTDLLIALSCLLLALARVAGPLRSQSIAASRAMTAVSWYLAYQLLIVMPVAVGYIGLSLFPVLRSQTPRYAVVFIPCLYFVVLRGVPPWRAIKVWHAAAICVSAYAVASFVAGGAVGAFASSTFRLRQTFGDASLFEGWLVIASLLLWKRTPLTYLMTLLGLAGLALTNHRSAYLALIASFAFHVVFVRAHAHRAVAFVGIAVFSLVMLAAFSPLVWTSTRYSLETMLNPSADANTLDRVQKVSAAWDEFLANPAGDMIWRRVQFDADNWEVHNSLLQLLSQEGVVSLVFWLAFGGLALRVGWRNRSSDRLSGTLLALAIYFFVFSLFNTTIRSVYDVALIGFILCAMLIQNELCQVRDRASPTPLTRGTRGTIG